MKEFLPYVSLVLASVSMLIAAWNVVRAGNWRKSDEAKDLFRRMDLIERQQALHEQTISTLPTKADLTGLTEQVASVQREVSHVNRGVERIEDHLMTASKVAG